MVSIWPFQSSGLIISLSTPPLPHPLPCLSTCVLLFLLGWTMQVCGALLLGLHYITVPFVPAHFISLHFYCFIFFYILHNIPLSIHASLSSHSSVDGHLGCFLAFLDRATMNMDEWVSSWWTSSALDVYGINGSYGIFVSNVLRNHHSDFFSDCTHLHFDQQ